MGMKTGQFRWLIWKNFTLQFRRPVGTVFEILVPVVLVSLLVVARVALETNLDRDMCFENYAPSDFSTVYDKQTLSNKPVPAVKQKTDLCADLYDLHCNNTKGYRDLTWWPQTNLTHRLMIEVSWILCIPLSNSTFESEVEMAQIISAATDEYHAAVVFDFPVNGSSLPFITPYRIRMSSEMVRFNNWFTSRTYPYYTLSVPQAYNLYEDSFLELQHALDYTIIKFQNGEDNSGTFEDMAGIRREVQRFPYPEWKVATFISTMHFLMPIMMCLSLIYSAGIITKELVVEKETRLKECMKMMGLSNWLHWSAWFVKCFIFLMISGLLMSIILKAGEVFRYSDYGCIFILFTLWITAGIMWCFAVSVLFSKAKTAMVFAIILWFLNYILLEFIVKDYFDYMISEKLATCLLHNTCLGLALHTTFRLESQGIGVTWSTLTERPSPRYDVPIAIVWIMLCVDILLYGLIAWYIEAVFPGEYGIPRKFYFPFQRSYWLGPRRSPVVTSPLSIEVEMDPKTTNANFEEVPQRMTAGISIRNLTKVYKSSVGDKVALDNLSLNMYQNQITSLLGHNGAGKTTTMSILTGLFQTTSGSATINGYDIQTGMDTIRQGLGFCPQHNILFSRLTVKEHLIFFQGLKGIVGLEAEKTTEIMICELGLVDKTNCKSDELSGGMKRKLSVALALIGQPHVVMLDEPTTGMDPCARRSTWDLLLKYKPGKTMVLTTHSMDEADLLGDRIAIMANGHLLCCGTSQFLKNRFGIGYHLTLVKQPKCDTNEIRNRIHRHVPEAVLRNESGAELSFILPREKTVAFKEMCKDLEENRLNLGIDSFGISVTTLEDVFLKVDEIAALSNNCNEDQDGNFRMELSRDEQLQGDQNVIHDDVNSVTSSNNGDLQYFGSNSNYGSTENIVQVDMDIHDAYQEKGDIQGFELKWQQLKAIFIKRLTHSKRDVKAIVTQLILPLVLVFFGLFLTVTSPRSSDDQSRALTMHNLSADNPEVSTFFADLRTGVDDRDILKYLPDLLAGQNIRAINVTGEVFQLKRDNSDTLKDGANITDEMDCCFYKYLILNEHCADVVRDSAATSPYNENMCSDIEDFGYYNCPKCLLNPGYYNMYRNSTCPIGSDKFILNNMKTFFEEYVLRDSSVGKYFDDHVAGITLSTDKKVQGASLVTVWYSNQPYHASAETLTVVDNALLHFLTNTSYAILVTNDPLPTSASSLVSSTNEQSLLLAICVAFGLGFLAASFAPFLISEKASKAKLLQFLSGLDPLSYWFGTLLWDVINYGVVLVLLVVLFAVIPTSYAPPNLGETTLLLLLFGWSAIPMTYVLSTSFTSSLVGYGLITVLYTLGAMATLITVFILELLNDMQDQAEICDYIFMLLPTHCIGRAIIYFAENIVATERCTSSELDRQLCEFSGTEYEDNILAWNKPGVGQHCLYLFLEGLVWMTMVLLIEVHFFVPERSQQSLVLSESGEEDEDVKHEREIVKTLTNPAESGHAVVLTNLTKLYRGTFDNLRGKVRAPSVDHVCLTIPKGECFGLLGVNGAGKTSTFRMMTGDLSLSAGTAHINGYNIQTERREVQRQIGYCPQFDALVEKLTGREVLRMYARLRGIQPNKINKVVESCIRRLNLVNCADKLCGKYSGGNKRKLSTATAIVGNPPIIFLDEPTAGIDPKSRRFLWDTITQLKENDRCIVLTSHSMEECEALCTRLAIMVNGQFQCLGSPQHLKSRFGKGHNLMVKIEHTADTKPVKDFINNSFPRAQLSEEHMGMLCYQIDNDGLNWSYIFGEIEDHKEELQLIDYSVGQTSLEQNWYGKGYFRAVSLLSSNQYIQEAALWNVSLAVEMSRLMASTSLQFCNISEYPDRFILDTSDRKMRNNNLILNACTREVLTVRGVNQEGQNVDCEPWLDVYGRIVGPDLEIYPEGKNYSLHFNKVAVIYSGQGVFEVTIPALPIGQYRLEILLVHTEKDRFKMFNTRHHVPCLDIQLDNSPLSLMLVGNQNCALQKIPTPLCTTGTSPGRWVSIPKSGCDGVLCEGDVNILRSSRRVWAPYNCHFKMYSSGDLKRCILGKKVLLIGDSITEELTNELLQIYHYQNFKSSLMSKREMAARKLWVGRSKSTSRPLDMMGGRLEFNFVMAQPLGCGIDCVVGKTDADLQRLLIPHGNADLLVVLTGLHDAKPNGNISEQFNVFERYKTLLPAFSSKLQTLLSKHGQIIWVNSPEGSDTSRCDFLSKPRLTLMNALTEDFLHNSHNISKVDYFELSGSCYCGNIHKGIRFYRSDHAAKRYNGFVSRMVAHIILTLFCQ
ncbi:phospholipid-transporting ATPase ABCA3-like [Glandiceps talaboti]